MLGFISFKKKGFFVIYLRTDFWKVEKGFGKLIYESGFVEKEEFYDKFRKMVDYIFLIPGRGIDEYAFQAGHSILRGYVFSS